MYPNGSVGKTLPLEQRASDCGHTSTAFNPEETPRLVCGRWPAKWCKTTQTREGETYASRCLTGHVYTKFNKGWLRNRVKKCQDDALSVRASDRT